MKSGYWIAQVEVQDPDEYKRYIEAGAVAYAKYGAVCLARGGLFKVVEGTGFSRNVIWVFPSYQAALDCYHSADYQRARSFRLEHATANITIVEGI